MAERVNRQLGNLFRLLVGECYTQWICGNLYKVNVPRYHRNHIPTRRNTEQRDWTSCVNSGSKGPKYMRIRGTGDRSAGKPPYRIRDRRPGVTEAYPTSDVISRVISKFRYWYDGPYRVREKIISSIYVLEGVAMLNKVRATSNIRQLKPHVYGFQRRPTSLFAKRQTVNRITAIPAELCLGRRFYITAD